MELAGRLSVRRGANWQIFSAIPVHRNIAKLALPKACAMTAINKAIDLANDGEVAIVTINSPPVNALSLAVREGLIAAFDHADKDEAVKAVILICAGRTFIAGADISEFGKVVPGATLLDLHVKMEAVSKPIVAAIHGTALGGGLETALAASWRIAVPSAKLGFPEVNLGLLPGGGGTQRSPRVVGVEKALEMMTGGAPIGAKEALTAWVCWMNWRRKALCRIRRWRSRAKSPAPSRG